MSEMARRGGRGGLLAYEDDGDQWQPLSAADVNHHLRDLLGEDATAKDFRTWQGTVRAATALAGLAPPATKPAARVRQISDAMGEVAESLGNSSAVVRRSYVDPRVLDLFEQGRTINQIFM